MTTIKSASASADADATAASIADRQGAAPWEAAIPPEELALYRQAGIGAGRVSLTIRRPALLVIDMQYRSTGETRRPIAESICEYPTSCGEYAWDAVECTTRLIAAFREARLPVIYPHVAPKGIHDGNRFADKAPAIMGIPLRGYEFSDRIAPLPGDVLIPKFHASAFFGTPLSSHLVNFGVDTVFIVGGTTSGCVRATAVDASSHGFKVVIPHECVFDRSQRSHAVNLFDLNSKYADVMSLNDAIALLATVPVAPAMAPRPAR